MRNLAILAIAMSLGAPPCAAQIGGYYRSSEEGCPNASLLYERFAPGAFDLSGGLSLDWIPNGSLGYFVTRGITSMLPTAGGLNVGLIDDSVSAPQALGFAFPYPTGGLSTNAVEVSSNGYVYLEPGTITSPRCCDGLGRVFREFRTDTPSWALLGMDLDPGSGGVVWFNTAPGVAYVTWDQVPEKGQVLTTNTMQLQLYQNGQVSMIWSAAGTVTHTGLVGWSGGGGVDDDGPIDFTAAVPFDMGPSSGPLTVAAPIGSVPTIGRTFPVLVSNVPSDAVAGAFLVGPTSTNVGLDPLGMTGCSLLVTTTFPAFPLVLAPPRGSLSIPIPVDPRLAGVILHTQAAVVAPSVNRLGASTSNRGTMRIGNIDPVIVRASGDDNDNDDDAFGFWSVVNATSLDIVALRLSWVGAVTTGRYYFDTNEIGMRDRFDGGNSTTPLCRGTYRNGSDAVVGLDYTNSILTPCGGSARTGWTGSAFGLSPGDFRTLDFGFLHFNPGELFEFDADTDGGPANGGAMAGMIVTVRLSDGSTRTGALTMLDFATSEVTL